MLVICGMVAVLFGYGSTKASETSLVKDSVKNGSRMSVLDLKMYKAAGQKYLYIGTSHSGNWFDALKFCSYHNMGMLSLDTDLDHDMISSILIRHVHRILGTEYWFWTSGNDWNDGKMWMWLSSGKLITFSKWSTNRTKPYEHCLALLYRPDRNPSTAWFDKPCDKFTASPICESLTTTSDARTNEKRTILVTKNSAHFVVIMFGWIIPTGIAYLLVNIIQVLPGVADAGCFFNGLILWSLWNFCINC